MSSCRNKSVKNLTYLSGYLGGFSWAVLVAKVCIMHPNVKSESACEMIFKFFEVFSKWNWPIPVALSDNWSNDHSASNYGDISWNPNRNLHEIHQVKEPFFAHRIFCALIFIHFQMMPIITPTFPYMNSSFNVTMNTRTLIQEKMTNAKLTCQQICEGLAQWESLFEVIYS